MFKRSVAIPLFGLARTGNRSSLELIAFIIAVVMPIVSGLVYPTYYHKMASPWVEWTRLLEVPFLVCELLLICFAMHRGMEIRRIVQPLSNDIKIAAALLMTGMWFSSLFVSAVPATSIALSVATTLHILFAFSVYYLAKDSGKHEFHAVSNYLTLGLLAIAVYTTLRFQFPIDPALVPGGKIQWDFAIPGFISVRYLGTWAGAIAAFYVAMVIQRHPDSRPSYPELFLLVALTMAIWSGTRAAVFGNIGAFVAMIVIQRRLPSLAIVGRLCIVTGIAATMAWILLPGDLPIFRLFASSESADVNGFTSGRWELWVATTEKWLQAPLFGLGSGSTFWEVYLGWTHTQPHNAILQFLISWGLVGTFGAVWLTGRAIYRAQQQTNRNPVLWPFTAMLYCLLTMSMVDGAFYYPRFIMLIMLCLAVILADNTEKPA